MTRISENLNQVDSLGPGSGTLDAGLFLDGDLFGGEFGGGLNYKHRVSDNFSLFGRGTVGYGWGDRGGLGYTAIGGLRYTWH